MRSSKTAAAMLLIVLGMTGTATAAKAATLQNTIQAVQQHASVGSLADMSRKTREQVICLALTLYHEARGSTQADIMAVGLSTRNRVGPEDSYCSVIFERGQYGWTSKSIRQILPREKSSWERMVDIAENVITGDPPDTTYGSTSFFSKHISTPKWARHLTSHHIGAHVFVRVASYFARKVLNGDTAAQPVQQDSAPDENPIILARAP